MPDDATWTAADTETVTCCVDHVRGEQLYDLDPFGVVRCPTCGLVFVSPRLNPEALQRLYDEPSYHEGVYGDASRSPEMILQREWTKGRLDLAARESARPPGGPGCSRWAPVTACSSPRLANAVSTSRASSCR